MRKYKGMSKIGRAAVVLAAAMLCLLLLVTYALADGSRSSRAVVLKPSATGETVYTGGGATIDVSNAAEGYMCVKYTGSVSKVKLRIVTPRGNAYQYLLHQSGFDTFPFSEGDGTYEIGVYENVKADQYSIALVKKVSVKLQSSVSPFLYPNQFVDFDGSSQAVKKAEELAAGSDTDLQVVQNIYDYIISNVSYDTAKANNVLSGSITSYVPDVDETLSTGKGICFDYAALMASMLRSQNIPTRMEFGYVSTGAYHAWVDVYLTEVGWVNDVYHFDGKNWTKMDPTFGSSGKGNADITKYIGNGTNYQAEKIY